MTRCIRRRGQQPSALTQALRPVVLTLDHPPTEQDRRDAQAKHGQLVALEYHPPAAPEEKPMARKKVSTTVYFTEEQLRRLTALSARTRVPAAAFVREGLDLVLQRYEQQTTGVA